MSQAISPAGALTQTANRRLAIRLLIIIAASLVFVAVQPGLYKAFCEWTGIYDIDRADKLAHSALAGRAVRMEFDANSFDNGLRFRPELATLTAKTGNVMHVTYRVENTRDTSIIGQAVPSYSPQQAGGYVKKLDCFCFKQQTFAPHEVRELPVVFVLDPEMPADIETVTLSYTFFEVPEGSVQGASVKAKAAL
jgi:cytochrome c oxidase assembly protein subunit 11